MVNVNTENVNELEETFHCDICFEDLNSQNIQTKEVYSYNVAYVECPVCSNEHIILIDSKETEKIKQRLKIVKDMEMYLKAQLYVEQINTEDKYYHKVYNNELSHEEKQQIGEFEYRINEQMKKDFMQEFENRKYGFKELMRLWK